jgi:protein gp37
VGKNSGIEWTHHTYNPWRGCTKVSEGCKFCYAETLSKRNHKVLGEWGPKGARVIASDSMWNEPVKWNREAEAAGERRRVFCASLADVFEGYDTMPEAAGPSVTGARMRLWRLIEATPALDWLLLTKRPENISKRVPPDWMVCGFPANVWIGTSVENQATADKRIPHLLNVPAKVRFLSCEPLLEGVNLPEEIGFCLACSKTVFDVDDCPFCGDRRIRYSNSYCLNESIHWVIAGGESGSQARPMHPSWARGLRDQCVEAKIPFFFKQWGEYAPILSGKNDCESVCVRSDTGVEVFGEILYEDCFMYRVGKKNAGRLLDGVEWNQFPQESGA